MAAANPSESTIRDGCKKVFERAGAWVVVKHQTGRGVKGVPDLLVTLLAIPIVAEVKRPKGSKFESGQILQLHQAAKAGALAVVLRSRHDAELLVEAVRAAADWSAGPRQPWTDDGWWIRHDIEHLRPPKLERTR